MNRIKYNCSKWENKYQEKNFCFIKQSRIKKYDKDTENIFNKFLYKVLEMLSEKVRILIESRHYFVTKIVNRH